MSPARALSLAGGRHEQSRDVVRVNARRRRRRQQSRALRCRRAPPALCAMPRAVALLKAVAARIRCAPRHASQEVEVYMEVEIGENVNICKLFLRMIIGVMASPAAAY